MATPSITTEQLQEKCQQWQQRLRLADWDVQVEIAPRRKMGEDTWGLVNWHLAEKVADIKLICPEDYSGFRSYDMEFTLVHELLHLHFAPFDADAETPEQLAQEQAINAIASALVKLVRVTSNG